MNISRLLTDEAILEELGGRMARRRLDLELTQAQMAEQAGLSKRTVERVESGATAQMSSMIRIFRVLDLLGGLEQLIPGTGPRPMDLLQRKGKQRQRAPSSRVAEPPSEAWSWDDDA